MLQNITSLQSTENNISKLCKPYESIEKITLSTQPFGEKIHIQKGGVIKYHIDRKRQVFLLEQGSVALLRRGDGMTLTSERGPFILGITNQLANNERLYVRALEPCILYRLPLEMFHLVIEVDNLWKELTDMLVYTISRVYEHCAISSKVTAYDIICLQLRQLMLESPQLRSNMTAANYIMTRTYLSRSGVMKILSTLKKAGYIEMKRGVLIGITKLPPKY